MGEQTLYLADYAARLMAIGTYVAVRPHATSAQHRARHRGSSVNWWADRSALVAGPMPVKGGSVCITSHW